MAMVAEGVLGTNERGAAVTWSRTETVELFSSLYYL